MAEPITKIYVVKGEFECGCGWSSSIGYSFDLDAGYLCPYCFMELMIEEMKKQGVEVVEVELDEED